MGKDESQERTSTPVQETTTLQPASVPSSSITSPDSSQKKLLYGVLAGVGLLLLVLIVLLALLMGKKDSNTTNSGTRSGTSASQQSTSTNSSDSTTATKKIILTVPTENDKLEYVIYEPRQTATNTTIDFGIRNKCNNCAQDVYTGNTTSYFDSRTQSYLLDETAGKKYSTITDIDNKVLATPSCTQSLQYNEVQNCFVAFSKVPSGTTVSWVFGKVRIDGIKIQ